jgi:hypothetical protein
VGGAGEFGPYWFSDFDSRRADLGGG